MWKKGLELINFEHWLSLIKVQPHMESGSLRVSSTTCHWDIGSGPFGSSRGEGLLMIWGVWWAGKILGLFVMFIEQFWNGIYSVVSIPNGGSSVVWRVYY